MIIKESINAGNWKELRDLEAREREDMGKQSEALDDARVLREYALENKMNDEVVELFLEEALVWQHKYMKSSEMEKDKDALVKMSEVISDASLYLSQNNLSQWESRLARYKGRVADYEGKYQEAADFYQEAIEKVAADPSFSKNSAMVFEYKGFLVLDDLRLGRTEEGIEAGERLYQDYEETEGGKGLKNRDYTTWAIWRSGLMLNLCRGIKESGKLEEYREKIEEWLVKAEKDLTVPEGVKVWADLGFRKEEVSRIREAMV